MMGSDPATDKEARVDETPQHKVTISKPFYLGKYEVTQEQWTAVMGNNPSNFKGRSNPVENVS
jgi:formylglycine-generating enzyme required for sulfatase activity